MLVAGCLWLTPSVLLAAGKNSDEKYFGIESSKLEISVKETEETPDLVRLPAVGANKMGGMAAGGAGGMTMGGMVAWAVIDSGRPSGNYSNAYASVMPGQWANLSGWKKKEITYNYTVTNLMRIDVIRVKYVVAFFYGGTDQRTGNAKMSGNGNMAAHEHGAGQAAGALPQLMGDTAAQNGNTIKGSYLSNFTVRPVEVDIKWGFNYSLNVAVSNPMNIGTSDNPVAYLQADLNWKVSTLLYSKGGIFAYGMDGLGNFNDLTEKSAGLTKQLPLPVLEKPASVNWNEP